MERTRLRKIIMLMVVVVVVPLMVVPLMVAVAVGLHLALQDIVDKTEEESPRRSCFPSLYGSRTRCGPSPAGRGR